MSPTYGIFPLGIGAALATLVALSTPTSAQPADEKITFEQLLKSGWQIAGYASTFDNRSAMILLKHPTEIYLVQCLAGYDVTRTPRVYANCYELH